MVNGYIKHRQHPRLEVLFEIAKTLDVNPKEILKDKKWQATIKEQNYKVKSGK